MNFFAEHRPRGLTFLLVGIASALPSRAEEVGDMWGTAVREREYYRVVDVPIPKDLVVEAGAFVTLPDDRIAVGTRRGDLYLVDGVDQKKPNPSYHLFASGLD